MARKPRVEIQRGDLYHIITRGNNRQLTFGSDDAISSCSPCLPRQNTKLPFYLCAYGLMPNHIHLLIERREDPIRRVMHRVLTGLGSISGGTPKTKARQYKT